MRNVRAVYGRELKEFKKVEHKVGNSKGLQEELATLSNMQYQDTETRTILEKQLDELDINRRESRRSFMMAQDEYEHVVREFERAKLLALHEFFPEYAETARYIISHLITTEECLVCGNQAHEKSLEYQHDIKEKVCIICKTVLDRNDQERDVSLTDIRVKKNEDKLQSLKAFRLTKKEECEFAVEQYNSMSNDFRQLKEAMHERELRIQSIINMLPPEDIKIKQQKTGLQVLKDKFDEMGKELKDKREAFIPLLEKWNRHIVNSAEEIASHFNSYAQEFLFEECTLGWAPTQSMLGQGGEKMLFPAFALEMSGTDYPSTVRRHGPEDVSESQREFIDLSFRKALMEVVGNDSASLIIDAPESSLDSIFVRRAARTLKRFTQPKEHNRLIITSNLVDGDLIPSLLNDIATEERKDKIINLFEIAVPTAAVKKYYDEYIVHLDRLLEQTS